MKHHVDRVGRCRVLTGRRFVAGLFALCCWGSTVPYAVAAYPDRPIHIVVPLAPGGAVDIVARLIQAPLAKALGQPVVIDNRSGASGILGANDVAQAPADGLTLLLTPTTFTINPAVNSNIPYDPVKAFAPITMVGRNSLLILINPKVKANTLKEFVDLARANPGKLNYATPGATSQAHLIVELWDSLADMQLQQVPYRGGAPAVLATMSGETQMTLISPAVSLSQIESKALRALATAGPKREEQLPDVPTTAEAGFPEFKATQWVGLLTTAGTPKPIVDRLNAEMQKIIETKDFQDKLKEQGMTAEGNSPDEFGKMLADEIKQWTEVARKANIKE